MAPARPAALRATPPPPLPSRTPTLAQNRLSLADASNPRCRAEGKRAPSRRAQNRERTTLPYTAEAVSSYRLDCSPRHSRSGSVLVCFSLRLGGYRALAEPLRALGLSQ